eukprot:963715-Prorocentrum_lima.AAC.1
MHKPCPPSIGGRRENCVDETTALAEKNTAAFWMKRNHDARVKREAVLTANEMSGHTASSVR